jgi:hypothetical protein
VAFERPEPAVDAPAAAGPGPEGAGVPNAPQTFEVPVLRATAPPERDAPPAPEIPDPPPLTETPGKPATFEVPVLRSTPLPAPSSSPTFTEPGRNGTPEPPSPAPATGPLPGAAATPGPPGRSGMPGGLAGPGQIRAPEAPVPAHMPNGLRTNGRPPVDELAPNGSTGTSGPLGRPPWDALVRGPRAGTTTGPTPALPRDPQRDAPAHAQGRNRRGPGRRRADRQVPVDTEWDEGIPAPVYVPVRTRVRSGFVLLALTGVFGVMTATAFLVLLAMAMNALNGV